MSQTSRRTQRRFFRSGRSDNVRLPKALVINAECDVLRDEGEAYARNLRRAGVDVTATRYAGTIHDFVMLNPLADTPAVRGAIQQAISALRGALYETEVSPVETESQSDSLVGAR